MTNPRPARGTLGRAAAAAVACFATALALVLTQAPAPARAADMGAFDAGYIISDAIFFDSGTMTAASVQSFLTAKGAACVPSAGNTCLKDYTYQPPSSGPQTKSADSYCAAYTPAAGDNAGTLIAKVAVACGINPQVIVVTLQKEQGLVTAPRGGSSGTYQIAMGYGCPDSAACDTQYYGFSNQLYNAAHQFQRYTHNPTSYNFQVGITNQILYSPNTACGRKAVVIQNQATANLYDYTPYTPNAAALAAGYGTGDSCSSYGNRNFWEFFSDWFGSPTQRLPIGSVDTISAASPTLITVAGWALDPDTTSPINVNVIIDGALAGTPLADGSRPDVDAAFHKGANHGFYAQFASQPGTHQVCVWAMDSGGHGPNPEIGCKSVTLVNHAPIGSLDTVTGNPTSITVAGWALDPDTSAPANVHVYIDNTLVGAPAASSPRSDIAQIFGLGADHGFYQVYPASGGSHQVCVYAMDTLGRGPNPLLGCRTVTVNNRAPMASLDALTATSSSITVAGWALDPDTTASINIHVYVDGTFVDAPLADGSRPDVGRAFGDGDAHGFYKTYPVAAGSHQVCLYAMDSSGRGPNPQFACRTITVVNQAPFGSVDTAFGSASAITVAGWALDPDTQASISVRVSVDGQTVGTAPASGSRPDVGQAFGKGDLHGFYLTYPATAGAHQVCVSALDSSGNGPDPQIGCRSVTVTG